MWLWLRSETNKNFWLDCWLLRSTIHAMYVWLFSKNRQFCAIIIAISGSKTIQGKIFPCYFFCQSSRTLLSLRLKQATINKSWQIFILSSDISWSWLNELSMHLVHFDTNWRQLHGKLCSVLELFQFITRKIWKRKSNLDFYIHVWKLNLELSLCILGKIAFKSLLNASNVLL